MPAAWIYFKGGVASEGFSEALKAEGKRIIGGDPEVPIAEKDVWIYPIECPEGDDNISIVWNAHERSGRTEGWVTERSQLLSSDMRSLALRYGFPESTEVCADGDLRDNNKRTGFSGLPAI